ncbi:hypothetical protein BH09VER1_BH09VER1_31130 [soil metagenome]
MFWTRFPVLVCRGSSPSAITRLLGYPAESLIGRIVFEFIHPDDRLDLERAYFEVTSKTRRTVTANFRQIAGDGAWHPLRAALGFWSSLATPGVILTFRLSVSGS